MLVQQLLLSALVTRHAHGPAPALALLACSAALLALLLATRPTSLLWGLNLPVAVTALISKVTHHYNIHNLHKLYNVCPAGPDPQHPSQQRCGRRLLQLLPAGECG